MSKSLRIVSLILVGALVNSGQLSTTCTAAEANLQTPAPVNKPKYGDETPEAAIRSFYTALATEDAVTARSLLVSPEKMKEWVEVQTEMSKSFRRFGKAAVAHFGDAGKALQLPVPAQLVMQKLAEIKPTQNGDKAEWPTNPKFPSKLVREDGHWRLDLYNSFRKPEDIAQQNKILGRIAQYVAEIASGVEAGQFESIAAVREEFKRQRAKMNEDLAKEEH